MKQSNLFYSDIGVGGCALQDVPYRVGRGLGAWPEGYAILLHRRIYGEKQKCSCLAVIFQSPSD